MAQGLTSLMAPHAMPFPETWERVTIFCSPILFQTFNIVPCFMWNLTSAHLIWFSPAFISWIFGLFFLPGSHAQCCQLLCPCRCRQISIKSKLQNWRTANLISKAISDWGPFGGIRSKTNKQTRFFFPYSNWFFFFFTWQYPFRNRIFYQVLIFAVRFHGFFCLFSHYCWLLSCTGWQRKIFSLIIKKNVLAFQYYYRLLAFMILQMWHIMVWYFHCQESHFTDWKNYKEHQGHT